LALGLYAGVLVHTYRRIASEDQWEIVVAVGWYP
jgi:hypothetical protein